MNLILLYFAIKYHGNWDDIYKALERKEQVGLNDIKDLESKIAAKKWKYFTILDLQYHNKLKEGYKPPFVLWYQGDLKLLDNALMCLTGNYVLKNNKLKIATFLKQLEASKTIVNPHFKGVDQVINTHKSKSMVYVKPCGLDVKFNDENFSHEDLILSEYPFGEPVSKDALRNRNRIIATLSDALILFSSKAQGGMNHMVSNFLNMGKEIYCFPGDGSEQDGNSELIKQGANLITRIEDLG